MTTARETQAGGARHLAWPGVWNARDLGGLPVRDGVVRHGALLRASTLDAVDAPGWGAVLASGVRTVIDLRSRRERAGGAAAPPDAVRVLRLPLEEGLDAEPEFVGWMRAGWLGTPLYYARFVERWPTRCVDVVAAVAGATPGGVVVHCVKGCDRTGLIAALLLWLLGAPTQAIIDDYRRSEERLRTGAARGLGVADDGADIAAVLARAGTTSEGALRAFLEGLDLDPLRGAGLTDDDLHALRARAVSP